LGVTVQGLSQVHELAISSDGKHAYAINNNTSGPDSIVTFIRNPNTGVLTFSSVLTNGQADSVGTVVTGLEGEGHLLVSADGKHVYALGTSDSSIVSFNRNLQTGVLTFIQKLTDGDVSGDEPIAGLGDPQDLAISPDGKHLYVTSRLDSSILVFTRDLTSGLLTRLQEITNTNAGGPTVSISPDGKHVYTSTGTRLTTYTRNLSSGALTFVSSFTAGQTASGGGIADSLSDVTDITISSDGKHLYTLSRTDESIGHYQRNTTNGQLAYAEKITRGVADSAGHIVDGLQGAKSLTLNPTGNRLYATADGDDSIAVFLRDSVTGRLVYENVLKELGDDSIGTTLTSLNNPDGIAVSPDGAHVYVVAREGAITQMLRDGVDIDHKLLGVGKDLVSNFSSSPATAIVRGSVYNDIDDDGFLDTNEVGISGLTIYVDVDNSNSLTVGDLSTTTDASGSYELFGLVPLATYAIRAALQPGMHINYPSVANNHSWMIPLSPGEVIRTANFLIHEGFGGASSQVSGTVFQDIDADGIKDPGEPGVSGRTVYLDVNDNGIFDGSDLSTTTSTSPAGFYAFGGLRSSNYVVRMVPSANESMSNPLGNTFHKEELSAGANSLGVVSGDFNLDGRIDFATVDSAVNQVSVRLQQTDGTFASRVGYTVGSEPTGIAVGKFNNDAYPDIAVVHFSFSRIVLLINNGNGTFTRSLNDIAIPSGFSAVVAADFDGNGFDDLAVAVDGITDVIALRLNSGNGTFTSPPNISVGNAPLSIAVGHLDAGPLPDLVVTNYGSNNVQVMRNLGGGSFTPATSFAVGDGPSSLTIADINNDGKDDIVVANIKSNTISRLLGNGNGAFASLSAVIVAGGPRSIGVGDIDGDNDIDIVVGTSTSNDIVLLRNVAGNFSFSESAGLASFAGLSAPGVKGVVLRDIDGDGRLDIGAARGDFNSGALVLLDNVRSGGSHRLTLDGAASVFNQHFGIVGPTQNLVGDYDRNGVVEQADHIFWRQYYGMTSGIGLQADGNGNTVVDSADYIIWRNAMNAGTSVAIGAAQHATAESTALATTTAFSGREGGLLADSSLRGGNNTDDAIDAAFLSLIGDTSLERIVSLGDSRKSPSLSMANSENNMLDELAAMLAPRRPSNHFHEGGEFSIALEEDPTIHASSEAGSLVELALEQFATSWSGLSSKC
jgi:6-phosphogluconolactonase (cycloisomerase 2 family)